MKKRFLTAAKTTLILVYLVIVAGALVRMTGSGMGCPDWPKCFGYYIPPTDIEELTWAPNRTFDKGQVIIKDESLLVAKRHFTTGNSFDKGHWRNYDKHDYAIFNPSHTWVEYINRLIGAIAGIATIIMAVFSIGFWKDKRKITILSWLAVFLMGLQGWLGATVVYSVLNPVKITLHMIVALVIVALLLYIIDNAKHRPSQFKKDKLFRNLLIATLVLSLIQIVLGTQVRQFVDDQVKIHGYNQMEIVLRDPKIDFFIHRSLSILVIVLNLFLLLRNRMLKLGYNKINWIMCIIGMEISSGLMMYYADFPFGSQALHMVMAAILFGLQFYLILESRRKPSLSTS